MVFGASATAPSTSAAENILVRELRYLADERLARIIGPIRQEVLSGIANETVYERLRLELRTLDDEPLTTSDFELAARLYNQCRSAGVAGSDTDLIICAVALDRQWSIFTTDPDFKHYQRVLGVQLHAPRNLNPLH